MFPTQTTSTERITTLDIVEPTAPTVIEGRITADGVVPLAQGRSRSLGDIVRRLKFHGSHAAHAFADPVDDEVSSWNTVISAPDLRNTKTPRASARVPPAPLAGQRLGPACGS